MSFGKSKEEKDQIPAAFAAATPTAISSSTGKPEAFIGRGTKIVGTITFGGPAEVEGTIEGELIAQDRLTIGESAVIKGKITGTEIVVKGEVNGDIIASKRLSLRKPARIFGNVTSTMLSIEEGVTFDGKCAMNITGAGQKSGDGKVMSFGDKPVAERVA